MPRTGRRPGQSGTRAKILGAAREQFARYGYDRATIRAIATSARVDPKLVMHFHGSKDDLFAAAMDLPIDLATLVRELTAPGIDGLGERLVRTFVATWDSPTGRPLVGLIRSVVSNEEAAAMMRQFFTHTILEGVTAALRIDEPRPRASLVASQLFGIALVRYVIKIEPVASATPDELASWVGPTVQSYLARPMQPSRR